MIDAILETVRLSSVLSSFLLGAMIGSLYGYTLDTKTRPIYPFQLFGVGLAFIVMLAIFNDLANVSTSAGFSIGRGILWTVLCLGIPVGRWLRIRFEEWRLARKVPK